MMNYNAKHRGSTSSRFVSSKLAIAFLVAVSGVVISCLPGTCSAQQIQFQFGGRVAGVPEEQVDTEMGAVLKTNPELEDVLKTADRKREDGQYRVASKLWQIVLERSGDALYSDDGSTYFSLVEQVEAILAGLPPEGLTAYRVIADAEAKEVLAQATSENDVIALNKVVRLYFISSLGDDAAFQLGCIYLDQFDFIGARRMFEKIAKNYPDPSIPMEEVYARIALCQSYLGDLKSAKASLKQADLIRSNTERVDLVRKSLGELATDDNRNFVNDDWKMPMGNNRRYGTMRGVPDAMMDDDLKAVWQFYYEPRDKYAKAADLDGNMLSGKKASGEDVQGTMSGPETRLVKAWRDKGWRPAGELLIDGDRVFFKTGGDLSVWSREKIEKVSQVNASQTRLDSAIAWRSVWKNAFQVDDATQMMNTIRKSWGGGRPTGQPGNSNIPTPYTASEVNLFGDRIFQEMSIYNGVVYSVEGQSFDGRNMHNSTPRVQAQWNASFRRTRSNFLTAYDAKSGVVQWTLPRETKEDDEADLTVEAEEESPWLEGGGFMSAPVGFGDLLLAPVNIGGAISIYAFDPNQEGKTVWQSFLCDEPETGSVPWSAIDLSIEGSDLFVTCGMGVVFVLDPATGTVRFAKRYRRIGTPDNFGRRRGWTVNRLNFDGWSNDMIIPYGRQMICFGSDTDTIEAFDRNTGKLIWRSEMNPVGYKVDYVIGVYDDMLYAGGLETVIAYDLKGEGRMVWGTDQLFDGKQSLGRAMVTPKGIYVPVEDTIFQFSLKGDKGKADLLAKVHVELGTNAPVGNLYSDGQRFWVHGANRLYALGRAEE